MNIYETLLLEKALKVKYTRRRIVTIAIGVILITLGINLLKVFFTPRIVSVNCKTPPDENPYVYTYSGFSVINNEYQVMSSNAYIILRFIVAKCEVEAIYIHCNKVNFILESSTTCDKWQMVCSRNSENNIPQDYSWIRCSLPDDLKQEIKKEDVIYFKIRPIDNHENVLFCLKSFKLTLLKPKEIGQITEGSFWKEAIDHLCVTLPVKLLFLIALLPIIFCKKVLDASWKIIFLGALLWAISVAFKSLFAIAMNSRIESLISEFIAPKPASILFSAYIGVLTGIFECGIFLFIKLFRHWKFPEAVSLGIGFGSLEVLFIALALAISMGMAPDKYVPDINAFSIPLERIIALLLHTSAATMIVYSFETKRPSWFFIAFCYKSVVDSIAAYLLLYSSNMLNSKPLLVEFYVFWPVAILGLLAILYLKKRWKLQ
jgi:hypothetical protein